GGNVRAGYNYLLNCYPRLACPGCGCRLLCLRRNNRTKSHRDHREAAASIATSFCRGALALSAMAVRRRSVVATKLRLYETASNTLEVLVAVVRRTQGWHSGPV